MQVAPNSGAQTGTIYFFITSPRLPAGLLSAAGWELAHRCPVFAAVESPTVIALRNAGVDVTLLSETDVELVNRLLEQATKGSLIWVASPAGDGDLARLLAGALVRITPSPTLEAIYASWDPPGARLLDVVAVMDRLRSPGGCPWDAEQTHASLMPYLLEEAYEAYDALVADDIEAVREELGDVLLQVVFHSRLGQELPEPQRWSIDDVAADLVSKLIRRHPHVFADGVVADAAEVNANWEEIKRTEKPRKSTLDGIARAQPALSLAAKYLARADKSGLDVTLPSLPASFPANLVVPDDAEELGDLLLAIVAAANQSRLDAEAALRAAADRFAGQIRAAEAT